MNDLYNKAKTKWGVRAQLIKAIEEMSELTKELAKSLNSNMDRQHIAEEVADVKIMIEQIELFFEIEALVKQYKRKKLDRLERLVSE